MNRKSKKLSADEGLTALLGVHTKALEENSQSVVEILELLSLKTLTPRDKNALKKIKKELKGIDKRLDNLGNIEQAQKEEEDWF